LAENGLEVYKKVIDKLNEIKKWCKILKIVLQIIKMNDIL
jgi:hypothetical protein